MIEIHLSGAAFIFFEQIFQAAESDYEYLSAIVYQVKNGWYLIALKDGVGWIASEDAGRAHPLEELVLKNPAYLTNEWNGQLWNAPSFSSQVKKLNSRFSKDVRVLKAHRDGEQLWFQVEILSSDLCAAGSEPEVVSTGWVLAYSNSGKTTIWFSARGC